MKKKFSIVVFFTVLFLAVGAFHYQGSKSTVTATDSDGNISKDSQLEETAENNDETETTEDGQETKASETEKNSNTESDENDTAAEESKNTSSTDSDSERTDEKPSGELDSPQQESIKFGNDEYVDISDVEKFKDLREFAQKHGARPFAIENSDCFAIIKDGVPLLFFSVGTVSAGVEEISVLKDYFTDLHNFSEETGIASNIDMVAETGAEVQVDFPDGAGYLIFKKDNTVVVNWG
ncbi:hypothetical protein [Bacillus sp. SG-1]|uniref:hypothetical protein n=1 Tax=Bacillus sp. SG-1 TaxID=161544 RepID=UPI0001543593|nr:hypothetical protein [Bacillus sp. SG-1]EDL64954.1 hypothetical protein BSG1_20550 [Bacillus sp. SG-1]